MKMAKQNLKEIQAEYSKTLERIKKSANEENIVLRERLSLAKIKIEKLTKQLKMKGKSQK